MNIPYKKIDLKQINTFITVCKLKNISIAAESLLISQSSVTQQIKSLERNTNSILFKRTPHGVELTEIGELFYLRIKDHYKSFDYAISQIENFYKVGRDTIHIAAHYPYITHELPNIISNNKEIPIKIYNISRKDAEQRMFNGDIDVTIYPTSERHPEFIYHHLSEYKPILIFHKDNTLSKCERITKEDLLEENFITIDRKLITLDGFSKIYDELSLSTNLSFENGNWDILMSMVNQNLGVALVSDIGLNHKQENILYKDMSHIFRNMSYQISIADPLLINRKNIGDFIRSICPEFHSHIIDKFKFSKIKDLSSLE